MLKPSKEIWRSEISVLDENETRANREQIPKALIRLHGCAGWSAPWLFICNSQVFSRQCDVEAQASWLRQATRLL